LSDLFVLLFAFENILIGQKQSCSSKVTCTEPTTLKRPIHRDTPCYNGGACLWCTRHLNAGSPCSTSPIVRPWYEQVPPGLMDGPGNRGHAIDRRKEFDGTESLTAVRVQSYILVRTGPTKTDGRSCSIILLYCT
jgi:hypothetical protein